MLVAQLPKRQPPHASHPWHSSRSKGLPINTRIKTRSHTAPNLTKATRTRVIRRLNTPAYYRCRVAAYLSTLRLAPLQRFLFWHLQKSDHNFISLHTGDKYSIDTKSFGINQPLCSPCVLPPGPTCYPGPGRGSSRRGQVRHWHSAGSPTASAPGCRRTVASKAVLRVSSMRLSSITNSAERHNTASQVLGGANQEDLYPLPIRQPIDKWQESIMECQTCSSVSRLLFFNLKRAALTLGLVMS